MDSLSAVGRLALVVAGYVACGELVLRRRSRSVFDANEAFWAGAGVFAAAFVLVSLAGRPILALIWILIGAVIVLAVVDRARRRVAPPEDSAESRGPSPGRRKPVLAMALCVLGAAGFVWLNRHFGYVTDGFTIYVSRALSIHFDGGLLPTTRAPAFFSRFADYPPLVSLTEALLAGPGNPFNFSAAKIVFPVFFVSLLVGTYALARRLLVSPRRAAWAPAIVALIPAVSTDWNVGGFADLPMAAAVAATVAAWGARNRSAKFVSPTVAWIAASILMIKPEGAVMVACMAAAAFLSGAPVASRRSAVAASILLGDFLVLELFRRRFGFPVGQYGPIDGRHVALAAHRLMEVAGGCAAEAVSLRHWGVFWWLAAASCAVFATRRADPAAPVALLVALAGAAFASIFLFSNWGVPGAGIYAAKDLGTHISLAYSRLLEHVVGPAAVVVVAAYSRLAGGGASPRPGDSIERAPGPEGEVAFPRSAEYIPGALPHSPSHAPEPGRHRAPALLLSGVALLYLALSPWRIYDRGYNGQDFRAADAGIRSGVGLLAGRGWNPPSTWSRHGILGFASHVPFVVAGGLLFGADTPGARVFASLEPLLETVALLGILLAWARRLGTPARALAVTLGAAFTTMLWPYAYIGLETTQSLALLAAGYLALASPPPFSRGRTAGFVTAAIFAVCAKSTGVFLVPAVAFLGFEFFRGRTEERPRKARVAMLAAALGTGLVFAVNAWTREFFWRRFGGSWTNFRHSLIRDPFLFLAHAVSLVASPNKGLLFYAPLAVLGLFGLRRVVAGRPRTGAFVALTFGGLVAGFSLLKIWADETWGPRYLHAAVVPLMLCLAVPGGDAARVIRRLLATCAALLGGAVSLLGVLFVYGGPYDAASAAGQNTLEAIQGDVVWNPIRFAVRILGVALHPAGSHLWVASHYWWFVRPPGSAPEPVVDLAKYAHFQSRLLAAGTPPGVRLSLSACAVAGAILVARAIRETRRESRAEPSPAGSRMGDA